MDIHLKLKQFIQFGCVGALNTALTYGIYLVLYKVIDARLAIGIGYAGTSLLGWLINHKLVFDAQGSYVKTGIRFYLTYGFTLVLSIFCTHIWVNVLEWDAALSPLFALAITVPTNFLFCKYWVFKSN